MEVHIKSHQGETGFKCDEFDNDLSVEWRMKKHRKPCAENTKCCHYFNNNKVCPFNEKEKFEYDLCHFK